MTIVSIGLLSLLLIIIGTTFAVFNVNLPGSKTQSMNTGCLKIEMSDNGNLSMEDAYPVLDKEGLSSKPYTYTI